jgi:hypothetical protein
MIIKVTREFPMLRNFQGGWPVYALIQQYLKNTTEQSRKAVKRQAEQTMCISSTASVVPVLFPVAKKSASAVHSNTTTPKSTSIPASSKSKENNTSQTLRNTVISKVMYYNECDARCIDVYLYQDKSSNTKSGKPDTRQGAA